MKKMAIQDDDDDGTRPALSSHASLMHTFEAVAGSRGSGCDVSAPAVSRVMGGAPERNKYSKKIGEITFGGGFL